MKNLSHMVFGMIFMFFVNFSYAGNDLNNSDLMNNEKSLKEGKYSLVKGLSELSKTSYEDFNKSIPIEIYRSGLDETGQARRVNVPMQCTIFINDTGPVFDESSSNNPFLKIGFNLKATEDLHYLHEMAHCMDDEAAPEGVEAYHWKEALADGYAIVTLLENGSVSFEAVRNFKKYRNNNKSSGSALMLENIVDYYKENIRKQNLTPSEKIEKIKLLRRSLFVKT